jgi:sugar phosphate isomerase/epimerase
MIRLSAFADEISPDPNEQLDCLKTHGIRFIEFRSLGGTNVLDLSPQQHQTFRDQLRANGFGLSALGSPIGKIPITDPFEPHEQRFETAMRLAEFYETPRIRVFSFYIPAGTPPEACRDEVLRRMTALARRASERGLMLVLENEKGIYGDTADRVADVLQSVGSEALAHAFDPANYVEVGQEIPAAWSRLKNWVRHFHVKDYRAADHCHVPAGEGDGRIPDLLADAVASGFDGFAVLEPHLIIAEKSHGFTGPQRFADAANALKNALSSRQIAYS